MITRRLALLGGGAAAAATAGGAVWFSRQAKAIRNPLLYTFGPYEFARHMQVLSGQLERPGLIDTDLIKAQYPDWDGGSLLNRHIHITQLSDYRSRSVTAPNNDTLYTSTMLDLFDGPVEMRVPDVFDRYFSISCMDLFGDQVFYLGTRVTGGKGGRYWIAGPTFQGDVPEGVQLISLPSNDFWLLARVFVAGSSDLEAARAVQAQLSVQPVAASNTGRPYKAECTSMEDAANYLDVVNEALGRSPLTGHSQRATQFSDMGVRPGEVGVYGNLSPTKRWLWSAATKSAEDKIADSLTERQSQGKGWLIPPPILGDYGDNDEVRAGVSLIGFGALTLDEAMYFRAKSDSNGERLNGNESYRIVIPAEGVPVDAFWSLSMYKPEGSHRVYFYPNEIDRYAINSGSDDLTYQEDGSIVLALQRDMPEDSSLVWMPTPDGPFEAFFRTYLPRESIRHGNWQLPEINKL